MIEKTLPWWRKALKYALGGIRSGFGLFSRSPKSKAENEPEMPAALQENPEEEAEAELTEHSPNIEPIAEAVSEAELIPAPEATAAPEPEAIQQAQPVEEETELIEPSSEIEPLAEAVKAAKPVAGPETMVAPEPPEQAAEPAPDPISTIAPSQQEEAMEAATALDEPAAEVAPEEIEQDQTPEADEAPEEDQAPIESSEQSSVAPQPFDIPAEAPVAADPVPAPIADPNEPADPIAEPESKPEAETVVEPETVPDPAPEPLPAAVETIAPADEPAPEQPAPLIESIEAAIEEAPEPATGQPGTLEDESAHQAPPEPETDLERVPQVRIFGPGMDEPEPTHPHMDLIEPTPEPAEVTAAPDESAPVTEAEASESVPAAAEPTAQAEVEPAQEAVSETAEPVVVPAPEPPQQPAAVPAPPPAPAEEPAPKQLIKLETRDNEADLSPFSVVVAQVYDGPLDLLLDLIRKQDIDIYDIPIARITAQFLAYVNQLKATDVDVAGEFIYTASLLIHIKSKMLLPRAPSGPDDAAEDPRRELVERLLEHERFKNAAQMLQQKQMLEAATWTNPGLREFQDDAAAEPEIAADTVDLVRIFRDILERARRRPVINLQEDSVTVGQMIQFLARRLTMEDKPVALRRLLSHTRSERALIAMFLALLELVRLQAILLRQDRAFSEIFIKKHTGFESVMNDGLVNAHDDWR
jgi:segregation and condensation protein A